MANQLNDGGILRADNDYLAKQQTVPQNASADGNGGSFENLGKVEGAVEVIVEVGSTAVTLTDTKVLTVKLQESDDDSSFADLVTLYTVTASSTTLAVGTILGRYIVPKSAKRYIKAVITTNDASAAGKLNVFNNYLAR